MASITVKITLGDEMRRFSVKVEDLTYGALDQRVRELFRLSGPTGSTKFLYTDEEGDIITMSSEEEMQEALALALSCTPAILRLKITQAGAPASADPDKNRSAEPSKTPADDANKTPEPTAPDLSDLFKSIGGSLPCAFGPGGFTPDNMDTLMKSVAESLPRFADSLPDELKKALPAAELDIAATMANNPHLFANAGASAASVAEMAAKLAQQAGVSYSVLPPHGAKKCGGGYGDPCVHPGVTCDKSGMSPIVGNRFNLVGHNYDLCEAEYRKLPDAEKVKFVLIEPPFGGACTGWRAAPMAAAANAAANMMNGNGVHWNVSCDKSGMSPIVGNRYTLVGHNYDLCEAEFLKLPDAEKAKFEKIAPPAPPFVPPHCRRGWNGGWNKWGCARRRRFVRRRRLVGRPLGRYVASRVGRLERHLLRCLRRARRGRRAPGGARRAPGAKDEGTRGGDAGERQGDGGGALGDRGASSDGLRPQGDRACAAEASRHLPAHQPSGDGHS